MDKPSYSTSKRYLWVSMFMAWAVILILAAGSALDGKTVEFGTIAVPSMVAVIVSILGIHRGLGSLDMMTAAKGGKADPPEASP